MSVIVSVLSSFICVATGVDLFDSGVVETVLFQASSAISFMLRSWWTSVGVGSRDDKIGIWWAAIEASIMLLSMLHLSTPVSKVVIVA
jgi:hypothetical protein